MAAVGAGKVSEVEATAEKIRERAPRFTVSGWLNIIKYADPADAGLLSTYLIDAGIAP